MRSLLHHTSTFALAALLALAALGGCAEIGEEIDCEQMCDELQTCVDSDIDVERCSDRCDDQTDNHRMRDQLDECTDCLDHGYACAEIDGHCPACQGVMDALL